MNKFIFSDKKYDVLIFILGIIISIMSGLIALLIPLQIRQFIDIPNDGLFNRTTFFIAGLFIIQAMLSGIATYLLIKYGENQVKAYRTFIFRSIINSKVNYYDDKKSGELASRIVNDTSIIRNFITNSLVDFTSGLVIIVGAVIMLFLLDWRLSLVMFLLLPLMILIISPLSNFSGKYGKKVQDYLSELTGFITESIQQIRLIKTSTAEKDRLTNAEKLFKDVYVVSIKSGLIDSIAKPLVFLTLFSIVTIIFGYGGQRVTTGTLTVGTLVTFLVYLFQLLTPLSQLGQFFTQLSKVKGATMELNALAELEPEKKDGKITDISNKSLSIKNVSFSYGDKKVLKEVSIDIPANHKIAIVGPSGSGKTTIVNLLERLYEVSEGKISIEQDNINDIALNNWRQQTALVSQDISLLSGTIYDNLIFGLHSIPSENDIDNALIAASLKEEIDNFESGLQTVVGERGMRLSGGQRQRLQIARAFLRNPKLLILDEATSNLDSNSEESIITALRNITKNKTTIAIAHRLSTIIDADKIYFLEKGVITGEGTHKELLIKHSVYASYVEEQML